MNRLLLMLPSFISITALALSGFPQNRAGLTRIGIAFSNLKQSERAHSIAKAAHSRKIFIARRADNSRGSGTQLDPFNARDDLHAIWARVVAARPRMIEFSKSTYVTTDSLAPISDCDIQGNGATIQAAASFGVSNRHKWIFQIGGDGVRDRKSTRLNS